MLYHLKIINQAESCACNCRVIDTGAIYGSKTVNLDAGHLGGIGKKVV
jgi:hypothetical protein